MRQSVQQVSLVDPTCSQRSCDGRCTVKMLDLYENLWQWYRSIDTFARACRQCSEVSCNHSHFAVFSILNKGNPKFKNWILLCGNAEMVEESHKFVTSSLKRFNNRKSFSFFFIERLLGHSMLLLEYWRLVSVDWGRKCMYISQVVRCSHRFQHWTWIIMRYSVDVKGKINFF